MKQTSTPKKKGESPRLTRDDWLDAAFAAVVEGGFDNVRVLVLADTLGVTRGSFYWHFTDHADLISSLLKQWWCREVELDKKLRANTNLDPVADLECVLEFAMAYPGSEQQNTRFELAARALGRQDDAVGKMLVEADKMRMSLFESKFLRITDDPAAATALATLFYLSIIGTNQALSRPASTPRAKQYMREVIATYLIHRQIPATSD